MPSVFLESVRILPSSGTSPSGNGTAPPGSKETSPLMLQRLPAYRSALRMSDEHGRACLVEQGGVGIRIDIEVYRSDSRRHLPEILVQGFLRVAAELHAFEIVGPDAHAEAVEPDFFVKCRGDGNSFRSSSGIAPPRLVHQIDRIAFPQEDVLEALAAVGCRPPCLGELPHAMGENQRIFSCINRLLIEHVGMVAVVGAPQRVGQHRAAHGETALLGYFQHVTVRTAYKQNHTDNKQR